jgi:hypothetical protein
MTIARVTLLSEDKLNEIRDTIAAHLSTVPAGHVVSASPIATYREKDGDTRFIVAVADQAPGASDEEGQIVVVERDKVPSAQEHIDALLATMVHKTVTGDTTVAGTVTVTEPTFVAGDVGRSVRSGGEDRVIATFVGDNEVTYAGDALPSSPSVDVSLLGAESIRDLAIDTRLRGDQDLRVSLTALAGGGIASGGAGATFNTIQVSNDYTVQSDIDFIAVDASAGPVTITMPPASDGQRKIHVKKIDSSAFKVTVAGDGADTIDGFVGFDILFQNNSYIFVSNEVDNWWVT